MQKLTNKWTSFLQPSMTTIPDFPTLYDKAKTGKTKVWSVKVETRGSVAVILTSHGYIDGKIQILEREITMGKNIGKKNETTPLQQAICEAQSDWNKKTEREGYKTSIEALETISHISNNSAADADDEGTNSLTSSDIPRPMLAHPLDQRKLDGVRCLAISGKGPYSRNALPFENLGHIQADVNKLPKGTILDGEVYSDTVKFQALVGLVKKKTLTEEDKPLISTLYLCVYDIIMPGTYAERKVALEDIFAKNTFRHLRLLPTVECASLEDVKRLHAEYVAEGYEGIILRNKAGVYNVGNRSVDLLKYKEFLDEEFTITGHTVGEGVEAGCVIWTCVTKEGASFSVRPRGTHEDRQTALATVSAQVGKKLTVRFQEWTEDKKPRFPVGLAIRDYE